ncbi:MAG TPA: metallophosphoesterase [Thermodesulfobacteriota bacterium]|nr:metallophosphoesterase [Thermodesulfobacteriota bacterium]
MLNIKTIFVILAIIVSACYMGMGKPPEPVVNRIVSREPQSTLKVWALSDIQPKGDGQRKELQNAIEDINENVPDVDLAIVAGDIVDDADESDFDWYVSTKPSSYIEDWYELAGNHDLKLDRGEGYKRKIRQDFYYSFTRGNILFILMSDEERGKPTEISDEAFEWWKDLVINNQDKIIVVATHAPLNGSRIPFSVYEDRQIKESERFTEVLEKHKVDIWLSGHLHLPHWLSGNVNRVEKYNGTIFVNLGGIRTEFGGLKPSESRIVIFTCGSDRVLIRSRNHTNKKYNQNFDAVFDLSKKYKCESQFVRRSS